MASQGERSRNVGSLARWLEHLERSAPIASAGQDPEGVHQLRVASGRLRVYLRLLGMRALRDDLRWLRSRASAARDIDVMLAREAEGGLPAEFAEWLRAERLVAHAALIEALGGTRFAALCRAIARLSKLDPRRAQVELERSLARVDRRLRDVARGDPSNEELHELRRAVRRSRYEGEWLGRDVRSLKRMQDALGAVNDAAIALRAFEAWPNHAAQRELGAALASDLERARGKAFAAIAKLARRKTEA